MKLHVVILAAGKGTRMRSHWPKVLHPLGGTPLLEHVIATAKQLKPARIHVVYGNGGSAVREYCGHADINWVEQAQQMGTGDAVLKVLPFIKEEAQVLILCGDVPLVRATTLTQLLAQMPAEGIALLTAKLANPIGLGRIVRAAEGEIRAIVEERDATAAQLQGQEINSGILVTTVELLRTYLSQVQPHNAQGEYYLTDIIGMAVAAGVSVTTLIVADGEEVLGVNDKVQLAYLERKIQGQRAEQLLYAGVSLLDPARFELRGELIHANDVTIDINVVVAGKVTIGAYTTIGPNTFLQDAKIGNNVTIKANCVIEGATIADNCVIGPYAHIRPDTNLAPGVHIGNFVEIKNSEIGSNSKANHLSYVGDATVGSDVNIGAGTITCNYDGVTKHRTVIGEGAFIGSNVALVAPISIGANATIGAGSVITTNAPPDRLTLARARQLTVENWRRKK